MLKEFPDQKVCVMGLGYVGLTLAVTLADLGFQVEGIEIREEVLDLLNQGKAHFYEPGLESRLRRVVKNGNIHFYKKIPENSSSTVFIITVGTPLGDDKVPRMDMVKNVSAEVSQFLKDGDLVLMRSTVQLGTSRDVVVPELDKAQVKYDLAFCPERTLEGRALIELREIPQIVGGLTDRATLRASQFFQMVTPTVVKVDDLETAEMIKLVDNTYRDVWFAYANEVARICDHTGIRASQVIQAGKLGYARTNVALPGPVGGPCLEKDSYILKKGVEKFGLEPQLIMTARRLNEMQPKESVKAFLKQYFQMNAETPPKKICFMGLAFKGKPATDDLRGTMAIPVISEIKAHLPEVKMYGFDAVVSSQGIQSLGLEAIESLELAFDDMDLVVVLNNHPVFSSMDLTSLADRMRKKGVIYDFWNLFDPTSLDLPKSVAYMSLGSHLRTSLKKQKV
ncbi:MAG: UDP-glucose 6-dehydrogenase [Bdellovibrionaceae bacterium]|nr:UDP-glucose 6-dehydrogenase [Pseudobdellovibrionaceae bacterium]|tara:strand:+ start:2130 stop:3485 length:1356 start_codon:yes stop_codon:yes gene_type:complete